MPAFNSHSQLESIETLHPVLMEMKECVVLDLETTGFSLDRYAEIIEIAAVKLDVEKRKKIQTFKAFVKPSNAFNIPKKIADLTGIAWGNVENAPYIEQVLPALAQFIGDLPVVAHNAGFDWVRFLIPSFAQVGLHATNRCVCSMKLASKIFPGRGKSGYNLESLCGMYGHEIQGHHDALSDATTTASLFLKLLDEYRRQVSVNGDDAYQYRQGEFTCPVPSKVPVVDFGQLVIRRISPYKGASKRAGPSIYVTTNFGKVCYSVRRQVWTCVELWTDHNAPIHLWGQHILHCAGMDMPSFVERYRIAS